MVQQQQHQQHQQQQQRHAIGMGTSGGGVPTGLEDERASLTALALHTNDEQIRKIRSFLRVNQPAC